MKWIAPLVEGLIKGLAAVFRRRKQPSVSPPDEFERLVKIHEEYLRRYSEK